MGRGLSVCFLLHTMLLCPFQGSTSAGGLSSLKGAPSLGNSGLGSLKGVPPLPGMNNNNSRGK